jgi:fibronectin-binding autotransporter adhesin
LTGTNTYSGGTTLATGELIVGNGGSGGTLGLGPVNDATGIDINRTGTLTIGGEITGIGSVTNDGPGTVILANNNSYSGGTTINNGTLQLGNGGGTGSLNPGAAIVDDGLLTFNSSGTHSYSGIISGTGNMIVGGGGLEQCFGANTYSGWTLINANTIFQPCNGNQGALVTSGITNNGILRLTRQDNGIFTYSGNIVGTGKLQVAANNNNAGDMTLTGSNSFTGGIYIGDNGLILGDNATPGSGAFTGNVTFTNNFTTTDDNARTLNLNRVDNFTLSGNIVTNFATPQNNRGIVQLSGSAVVTLTGNNTYGSGTVVSNGTLQVGNGGSTGSVGTGPINFVNGNGSNPFLINRSGTLNIPGNISDALGTVPLVAIGGVTLIMGGADTYGGATTVTNSSLFVDNTNASSSIYITNGMFGGVGTIAGPVTLDTGATLYVASTPSPGVLGTLTINNNLTLSGGNFVFEVNRSAAPSNSMVVVAGTLTSTASSGSLVVTNVGPNLHPGDRFVLFSQPLTNGALINVSGGRATWTNGLAVDGSVGVVTVSPPPILSVTNLGTGGLKFAWSDSLSIFKLQWQTNSLSKGIQTTWSDYPGGGTSPVTVPYMFLRTNSQAAFFRIISVP